MPSGPGFLRVYPIYASSAFFSRTAGFNLDYQNPRLFSDGRAEKFDPIKYQKSIF